MPIHPERKLKRSRRRSSIRRSTDEDIRAIHRWLKIQSARGVQGTFLCNWDAIKKTHKDGNMIVYIDGASGVPVAYQCFYLTAPGMLEVRHDMRNKGIGRKLVERRIKEAYERGDCFLYILCEPSSSIPFWKRMGFTPLEPVSDGIYAYRILGKQHELPANGKPIRVAVRFYFEDEKWNKNIPAHSAITPQAVQTPDGIIHLSERVAFFKNPRVDYGDVMIEIKVTGRILYCGKAKYPAAQQFGVKYCGDGAHLDQILTGSLAR